MCLLTFVFFIKSDPIWDRTRNLQLRRLLLYPIELLGHQNSGAKVQKIPICRDIMGIFNFNGFKLTVSDHYKIASIGKWPT